MNFAEGKSLGAVDMLRKSSCCSAAWVRLYLVVYGLLQAILLSLYYHIPFHLCLLAMRYFWMNELQEKTVLGNNLQRS